MVLTEEQQNVALKALATTLGKPVSEIEATLTGDSPGDVDSLLSVRIKAIRKEGEDLGHGKIQKFAVKKVKELFGIDEPADSMDELLTKVKEGYTPPVDPTKLTEEQVKKHPAFVTLESTLKNTEANHQKALDDARAEGKAEIQKANLTAKAIKALADFGAVINADPKIAAVQERMFLEQLEGIKTEETESGVQFWKGDKREENDKGFPLAEADFFKKMVESTYTTKVSEQKSSSGLNPGDGQRQQQPGAFVHFKGEAPKTQDELNNILRDKTLPLLAKNEARAYWEKQSTPAA